MFSRRTHSRSYRRAGAVAVVAAALVLSACSSGSSSSSGGSNSAIAENLTMELDGPVTSYDPDKGASFQDAVVIWSMYDTLVALDADGSVIPGLASQWKVGPNSADFTIRDGVTCSDGEKVTGNVVANSLNRFFDPKTAAPFLSNVIGAGNSAKATANGQTVTISLKTPFSGLLNGLTVAYTGVICSAGIKNPSMLQTGSDGTGGFVAKSQVGGSSYTFTRRDGYNWGPKFKGIPTDGARPKTLTMRVVEDENTRANLQTTNAMQIAPYTTNAWKRVAAQNGWTKTVSQQSDTFLMFNHTPGHATADRKVRMAIAEAIDRSRLNDVQSYGAGKLISNLGEPTYECYDASLGKYIPKSDPAAAGRVLKGMSLSVNGTNLLAGGDANSYVASALRNVGAKVEFRNMNNQQWVSGLFKPLNDWDATILVFANTSSNLISGANFFTGVVPPNGQNLSDVNNPAADAALKTARETTGKQSCDAMSKYQSLLFQNMDVLPLSTAPANVMFAPGVTAMVSKGFVRAATIRIAK